MGEKSLKEKAINGVMWSAVDRFSSQGIQFIFGILIARILLPEDYGAVVALGIFLAVAQAFIDSGFGNALVRKNDRTDDDFNTVFYFNVAVSAFFCLLLFLGAPLIASFFKSPLLVQVTRVVSLTLVINALGAVQGTKLTIDLDFKRKAIISIITITFMGVVGLWMAYKGYGVWALVAQNVVGSSVRTILQWVLVRWYPRLRFSMKSFKEMFSFGSKLLATSLIDVLWGNMYNLVIGKFFTQASLGLYNRAESFASFPSSNIYGLVQGVLYPSLCKVQDDKERLKNGYRQFIKLSSYVVFPMMIGLAAVADPFIHLILKDQWAGAIPLMQLLCFSLVWYPISAINITFPNILGRSDLYLKAVIWNKVIEVAVLVATVPFGLVAMVMGRIATSLVCTSYNTLHTKQLVGYGLWAQFKDIAAIFGSALIMGALAYVAARFVPGGHALKLGVGVIVGVVVYLVASLLVMREQYDTVVGIVKDKIGRK